MLPVRRCTHSGITGPGTLLPTLRVRLTVQECSPSTRFYGIPKTYPRRFEVVDLARSLLLNLTCDLNSCLPILDGSDQDRSGRVLRSEINAFDWGSLSLI